MKKRSADLLVAILMALGIAQSAQAQVTLNNVQSFRTPKRFALELRFGPYTPDIDAEFGGAAAPYTKYYGADGDLMSQLEFDWQFMTGYGSAAVGIQAGFFRQTTKAPIDGPAIDLSARSGDDTQLSLFPTAVLLVYRADQAWQRWRIPLVPYAKVGLNYTIWRITDGNDQVPSPENNRRLRSGQGSGGTLGWQAAAGLSLVLDFIDSGAARALDSETGVNHTHAFIEIAKYAVSGFGESGKLNVGDTTWLAGLMFEF
jgi:hypothetical protein